MQNLNTADDFMRNRNVEERHEDVAVRGGVKLCREYMQYLKDKNGRLKEEK